MATSLMGARRSAVEIVHEILSLCNHGGLTKTAIMYRSNLSYDQLRRYLSALCSDELLFKKDDGFFQVTPAREKALKRMSSAIRALRDLRKDLNPRP